MVYIDADYKCHPAPGDGLREVECPFLEGKCDGFLEGYRCVPQGETWTREDGAAFTNMVAPWKDHRLLAALQREYEKLQGEYQDMKEALGILEVGK